MAAKTHLMTTAGKTACNRSNAAKTSTDHTETTCGSCMNTVSYDILAHPYGQLAEVTEVETEVEAPAAEVTEETVTAYVILVRYTEGSDWTPVAAHTDKAEAAADFEWTLSRAIGTQEYKLVERTTVTREKALSAPQKAQEAEAGPTALTFAQAKDKVRTDFPVSDRFELVKLGEQVIGWSFLTGWSGRYGVIFKSGQILGLTYEWRNHAAEAARCLVETEQRAAGTPVQRTGRWAVTPPRTDAMQDQLRALGKAMRVATGDEYQALRSRLRLS